NKSEGLSNLAIQLDDSLNKLAQVESDHKAFSEHIKMLRKDEIEARNQLESLNQEIKAASRRLKMNNLPGITNFIWEKLNEAKVAKTPLDMKAIQETLANAEATVNATQEDINVVIEQAYLTERVIQYANRYRSSNAELASSLDESEKLFRNSEYKLALETAAAAI